MKSESRIAADTAHRVPYPNSKPRRIKLVALGAGGERLVREVAAQHLAHVDAVAWPASAGATRNADDVLRNVSAGAGDLERALDGADMVFVLATPDDDASFATAIASVARHRGVMLTGVLVSDAENAPGPPLHELRRACDMLVVTGDSSYVAGMLAALGT